MKETYIHNHKVFYDEEKAYEGADYLMRHLDGEEAMVFFDQAKFKGHITFESATGRHFVLTHKEGAYTIENKF